MTSSPQAAFSNAEVKHLIVEAHQNRTKKRNETVVRETLIHHLARIFPQRPVPWWVSRHIRGAEAHLKFLRAGEQRGGQSDSVVGLTAIEYESDLTSTPKWNEGYDQVRRYCAGLLNQGAKPALVRGVLSDTVDWHAYELVNVPSRNAGEYDIDDVELQEIDSLNCDPYDPDDADRLMDFWLRHFAREGTRPLTARSLTEYLAPTTPSAEDHIKRLSAAVQKAAITDPKAAKLVESLWTKFVSYLSENAAKAMFDQPTYVQEFYVALLARLICANILGRRALRSDNQELDDILEGGYFSAKGLKGLVEYDYFGWLTRPANAGDIRSLAKDLQRELTAFDFDGDVQEDLFGEMVSLLAGRAQRLLLGQEWTPTWLADRIAAKLVDALPDDVPPQFVDMCCGSGAMLVAVTRQARVRAVDAGMTPGSQEALNYVVDSATGFDIDPLAVMLAKVNWVVANRDWLEPFDGSRTVALPVYHADSLFALAPVFQEDLGLAGGVSHILTLDDKTVSLPGKLIAAGTYGLFDGVLDRAYNLGLSGAPVTAAAAADIVADTADDAGLTLDDDTAVVAELFAEELAKAIGDLHRRGRNGLWAFVIRNSYRPALVAGRFNGLISNPPWLALSRIEDNPFSKIVKKRAERFDLLPPSDSAPHLDMSTPFLAYAVEHYLADGAVVGCVLPGTIRRGTQHRPFREQVTRYQGREAKFDLDVDEVWRVSKETFKNLAAVVFGSKRKPATRLRLTASLVSPSAITDAPLYVKSVGDRVIWADSAGTTTINSYDDGTFQQGADLMPRTCVFVKASSGGTQAVNVGPAGPRQRGRRSGITALSKANNDEKYLLADSKKAQDFAPATRTLPSRFVSYAWLSKHLAPFDLCVPAACVVPFERTPTSTWRPLSAAAIAAVPELQAHLERAAKAAGDDTIPDFAAKLDYRSKLTTQAIGTTGWLVLYGAGGTNPAAAHVPLTASSTPVLIDQTLYWAVTATEDEATFQVGMLNSAAVLSRVQEFAPEGAFNERHLHTLPSKFLPKYDATSSRHIALVTATKALITELAGARAADPVLDRLFLPHLSLAARRTRIRKALTTLNSFADYDAAADDVFT